MPWPAPVLAAAPGVPSPPAGGFRPDNVGQPLGSVELRVADAKVDAFLHDLADFSDFYQLEVTGDPAGLAVEGREVLLVWFTRADGLAVLVTDAVAAGRMQAFFYVGPGGFRAEKVVDVMQGYRNKMSGYPAYAKP